jgi:hypothetical protein
LRQALVCCVQLSGADVLKDGGVVHTNLARVSAIAAA